VVLVQFAAAEYYPKQFIFNDKLKVKDELQTIASWGDRASPSVIDPLFNLNFVLDLNSSMFSGELFENDRICANIDLHVRVPKNYNLFNRSADTNFVGSVNVGNLSIVNASIVSFCQSSSNYIKASQWTIGFGLNMGLELVQFNNCSLTASCLSRLFVEADFLILRNVIRQKSTAILTLERYFVPTRSPTQHEIRLESSSPSPSPLTKQESPSPSPTQNEPRSYTLEIVLGSAGILVVILTIAFAYYRRRRNGSSNEETRPLFA
jgi:hypothetical protein